MGWEEPSCQHKIMPGAGLRAVPAGMSSPGAPTSLSIDPLQMKQPIPPSGYSCERSREHRSRVLPELQAPAHACRSGGSGAALLCLPPPGGWSHHGHMKSGEAAGVWFCCCNVSTFSAGAFTAPCPVSRRRQTQHAPGWEFAVVRPCPPPPGPRHSKQTGDVKTQHPEKCAKKETKRQSGRSAQRLGQGPAGLRR